MAELPAIPAPSGDAPIAPTTAPAEAPIEPSKAQLEQQAQQVQVPILPEGYVHVYDMTGDTPVAGSIHDSEITDSVASGQISLPQGKPVPVISPDGTKGTLDPSEAQQAFKEGWKYYTQADQDADTYGGPTDQAIAAAEGVGQGAFGLVATAVEEGAGRDPEAMRKTAEQNPWAHGVGKAFGFMGPAAASLGATGLAKLGVSGAADVAKAINIGSAYTQAGVASQAVEDAARLMGMGSEAATISGKLAQSGIKTGMEMALFQGGDEITKAMQEDPNQSAATVAANMGTAALLGGALGVGASGVKQLWRAKFGSQVADSLNNIKDSVDGMPPASGDPEKPLNSYVAKGLGAWTGTDEKFAQNWAANRDALKTLPPDEDILEHAQNHVNSVYENLADTKEAALAAQSDAKDLKNNLEQQFVQNGYDIKSAATAANDTLKITQKNLNTQTLNSAMDAGSQITQKIEELRQQGLNASSKAYDTLTNSGKSISLNDMNDKAMDLIGQLQARRSPEAEDMASKLQTYMEKVNAGTGGSLAAENVKPVIQELDRLSKYGYNATEFDKGLSPYYKQLRNTLDTNLKDAVPQYAEDMKPTAEIFSKLNDLKAYGTEEGAQKRIMGLTKPLNYKQDMDMLRDLQARTNGNFINDIENYANPEIRAARIRALPEYEANETAAKMERAIKDPEYKKSVQATYENSPEYKKMVAAQALRDKALSAKADLGGITPNNVAAKIRKGQIGNSQDILNLFAKFPALKEQGMPELLKLSGIRASAEKGVKQGSKHAVMYAIAGHFIGNLLGPLGGEAGALAGAKMGSLVDNYGPKVASVIIDKLMNVFGKPLTKALGSEANEGESSIVKSIMARAIDNDASTVTNGKLNIGNEPSVDGFKSMHDYISNLVQGNDLITKSAKNVFKPENVSTLETPNTKNLEKNLQKFWDAQDGTDASKHMNKMVGSLSNYMPDHATATGNLASNIANYLKSQKPQPIRLGALDPSIPPGAADNTQWKRTLSIAQDPLSITNHIKAGSVTPKDIADMKAMFPALYPKLAQELMNSMVEHTAKGAAVPYKTRLGLTLFAGSPLDSTMTPQGIMGAQPMPVPSPQQQTAQGGKSKGSPKSLSELPSEYRTPSQARQSQKQTKE